MRALAVRILRRHLPDHEADLLPLARDQSPRVLREVLLALARLDSRAADQTLLDLARDWNGQDRAYFEAVAIAARGISGQQAARFPTARGGYETLQWNDSRRADWLFTQLVERPGARFDSRLVEWTRLLRPRDADEYLLTRLEQEDLTAATRSAILAGLGPDPDAADGRRVLALLADRMTAAHLRRLALRAMSRNLSGGWSELRDSGELTTALTRALEEPELRADVLSLIGRLHLADLDGVVLSLATDRSAPVADRVAAIDVAAQFAPQTAGSRLGDLFDDEDLHGEVEAAVIKALVTLVDGETLNQLLRAPGISSVVKEKLVKDLGKSTLGALWLLREVRSNSLETALRNLAVAAGIEHPDASVRTLFLDLVPLTERPQFLGATVDRQEVLALTGDADRGREVYATGRCTTCHAIEGRGGAIGPALGVIGRKYGREALLQSILEPSLAISPDYATSLVETKDGRILVGIASPGGTSHPLLLRIGVGEVLKLPAEQIVSVTRQRVSLMPEQLAGSMTAQDLADLVAYMSWMAEPQKTDRVRLGVWVLLFL
ncbi:MAG: hypothetical protein EHM42_15495, partial [Planctomycetaceae bacterium]